MKRFWDKVAITSLGGCWEWMACRTSRGYGEFRLGGGMQKAHRVAYELVRGKIPAGLELDHLCRNTSCVHPLHLEAVTHHENVLRGALIKTHCLRGHPRTPENLTGSSRNCRICANAWNRIDNQTESHKVWRRTWQKQYRQKDEFKVQSAVRMREYRKTEKNQAWEKEYRERNRDKINTQRRTRYAQKKAEVQI